VFDSIVRGTIRFERTGEEFFCCAPASVVVNVAFARVSGNIRFFDTEIVTLDVAGGNLPPNILIRESPTLRSVGQTSIEDLGGQFRINSFFDVWTELSLDQGQTWIPSSIAGHVELAEDTSQNVCLPEPSSIFLMFGGCGLLLVRRKLTFRA